MVETHGMNLFYHSVENRKLCCGIRKMEPLGRALSGLDAWITGLRREQSVTRTAVHKVEWDEANARVKVNPLVDWSHDDVWKYIRAHNVPYNALHDRGYPSIGCGPCTRAIQPGEHERAGRWWWEHPGERGGVAMHELLPQARGVALRRRLRHAPAHRHPRPPARDRAGSLRGSVSTRSRANPGGAKVLEIMGDDVRPYRERKPPWFKVKAPGSPKYLELKAKIDGASLHTVCEEAACPNIGECWQSGTATFMILGDTCTRRCGFCNVKTGQPTHNDPLEPLRVAQKVKEMGLRHAVITSVDRDDLPDLGSTAFVGVIRSIRKCRRAPRSRC